eukprot:scaffold6148_cov140-Skeletonema_menzelii.AAC.2
MPISNISQASEGTALISRYFSSRAVRGLFATWQNYICRNPKIDGCKRKYKYLYRWRRDATKEIEATNVRQSLGFPSIVTLTHITLLRNDPSCSHDHEDIPTRDA